LVAETESGESRGADQEDPGRPASEGLAVAVEGSDHRPRQRLIEQAIAEMEKTLPAVLDKPLEQQSEAELFAGNFRRSLLFSRDVLDRPDDWGDMEFMKMKRDIATSVQSAAIRIKVAELRPPGDDSVVERLMRRVAAIRRGERVIEIHPGDVSE
jgi:hypothetical protein